MKVSDAIAARLAEWGITRTYGYPGAGINGSWEGVSRQMELQEVREQG